MNSRVLFRSLSASALAAALLLTGCSSADSGSQAEAVTVHDAWVKAADADMTAAFARLVNTGSGAARLLSATSPASADVEIHEVVDNVMRTKDDGVVIPARGEIELQPGGDHLMLIDLGEPLTPGTDVEIVATFEDGSRLPITAQVRDFAGADENYAPDAHAEHGSHESHG
ncbi:copper chaperone PCu(A)C [[Mycobacterium] burgundiense]|uniref:Copper chaperone PCu(A)C n=1 Tax=[Mycobacterium] burgundiense TaxID=3064286 RepID=A0ABM9LGK2_9MYCO|nr:copper chaperone PCu(A)C [Mycolicibacterium sp. MU0053]CAJ1498660.1 copper chaperone PCu(A)C [Mycolicibacterium sp. MU0053]